MPWDFSHKGVLWVRKRENPRSYWRVSFKVHGSLLFLCVSEKLVFLTHLLLTVLKAFSFLILCLLCNRAGTLHWNHSELDCHSLRKWLIHPKVAGSDGFWKLRPTTEWHITSWPSEIKFRGHYPSGASVPQSVLSLFALCLFLQIHATKPASGPLAVMLKCNNVLLTGGHKVLQLLGCDITFCPFTFEYCGQSINIKLVWHCLSLRTDSSYA